MAGSQKDLLLHEKGLCAQPEMKARKQNLWACVSKGPKTSQNILQEVHIFVDSISADSLIRGLCLGAPHMRPPDATSLQRAAGPTNVKLCETKSDVFQGVY